MTMKPKTSNLLCPLVVLGTIIDPHVERVVSRIRSTGAQVYVLDYLEQTAIALSTDIYGKPLLEVNGEEVAAQCLVWDRMKIIVGTRFYVNGDEATKGFAAHEWRALYTMMGGLNRDRVVNSLESRACRIKPYQQQIAGRCGFLVPPSIVTTSKDALLRFQHSSCDRTIMKSLSGSKVTPAGEGEYSPYNVMTMKVAMTDIEEASEDEVAFCPHFMQHEIEKSHELRVVIIGSRVIPFRIESQESELTKVDWRKGARMRYFSKADISSELETKILSFMRSMSLFTGSMDIIVDCNGNNWFLECNQDGAWAWLDDLCDGEIADAFANELMKKMKQIDDLPRLITDSGLPNSHSGLERKVECQA
ncbi:MAG: hypothetical protein WBI95_16535 [Pseudomonas veronii]|jgi:glutathione synthase/RimK-type ligase-like ATP-grasp enzyme|uniref:hypothetical protein n=1 Tax=Pseudomonas veronii TaxID=76761 RepID=UPI003C77A2E2